MSRVPETYIDPAVTTLVDEIDTSTTYLGIAEPGTASSQQKWQIKKFVLSGGDVTISYADGNANFDNIWDNRTSYSYS